MANTNKKANYQFGFLTIWTLAITANCWPDTYSELEDFGLKCLTRDRCQHSTKMQRSCMCDEKCNEYKDCCVDAVPKGRTENASMPVFTCIPYGMDSITGTYGIYIVSECDKKWNGSSMTKEICDMKHSTFTIFWSVPYIDMSRNIAYSNWQCVECNHANYSTLRQFQSVVQCDGLEGNQKIEEVIYNEQRHHWGVYSRNNSSRQREFHACDVAFFVPEYLKNSVRYCRPNLISTCAPGWRDHGIAILCAQYMSVVYAGDRAYRNPHCAICNYESVYKMTCENNTSTQQLPHPLFTQVNPFGHDVAGYLPRNIPRINCPRGSVWDGQTERCRQLVSAVADTSIYVKHGSDPYALPTHVNSFGRDIAGHQTMYIPRRNCPKGSVWDGQTGRCKQLVRAVTHNPMNVIHERDPYPLSTHINPFGRDPYPLSTDVNPFGRDPYPLSTHVNSFGRDPYPLSTHVNPFGRDPYPLSTHANPFGRDPYPLSTHVNPFGRDIAGHQARNIPRWNCPKGSAWDEQTERCRHLAVDTYLDELYKGDYHPFSTHFNPFGRDIAGHQPRNITWMDLINGSFPF